MIKNVFSPNFKKLISILNDGAYHSGTSIGHDLGLTRSGVWKIVKQLTSHGIALESVTNKGYRMITRIDLLEKSKIKKHLSKDNLSLFDKLFILDETTSTNDYLLDYAKTANGENAICFAEQQTAGRGRLGRQWVSPFAANIYMSVLWHFRKNVSELIGLNIVVGVAIIETIVDVYDISDVHLKWPNDIYWQARKLGGVLIDIMSEYNGNCAAVVGVGLNVNMPEQSAAEIHKPFTDLYKATGKLISRNKLSGVLLQRLISCLIEFEDKGVKHFITKWNRFDYLAGKKIMIKLVNKTHRGIARGINEQGHLLLESDEGALIQVTTGDASVLIPKS